MALLYSFLIAEERIKTNVLGKDIFFRFILPPIPKEICSLNNNSITCFFSMDFKDNNTMQS